VAPPDLVITGWGAVSAAGIGAAALTRALAGDTSGPGDITGLYPDPMPGPVAHAYVDFDVRAVLGRKGTSFLDRATSLAVVACGQAIEAGRLVVDDRTRDRIGIALGTTLGSFRSSSDYSRETMVADRPYLVNPVLFPNTVMNCATGQSAIRYGLRGVNSTIAGGRVGFLGALRYARNVLHRGYADAMLVGAVEEFTPHAAWTHHLLRRAGLPGEAAVVFVLRQADGSTVDRVAVLRSVVSGHCPDGAELAAALAACIRRALDGAGVEPGQVGVLATGELTDPGAEEVEDAAAAEVFGTAPVERIRTRDVLGDCGAANGALHLAAALRRAGGGVAVLAGWSPEGAVAAAVLEGPGGVGPDRG
jgi:3-oxoacyl-[acyl-carrier-protein] synthase II